METKPNKCIAIVSGKGGSGKTIIATVMGSIFAANGYKTTLLDSDVATGGLTYFLGLRLASNTSIGLSNLLKQKDCKPSQVSQSVSDDKPLYLVGIGDHRYFYENHNNEPFREALQKAIIAVKEESDITIIDCRGGIDEESIAVCEVVDEIIIIIETDTTSFRSTEHLVHVMQSRNISKKINGFIINKAFDDPSVVARTGTGAFHTRYLGTVPFDVSATKEFLIGKMPKNESVFGIQVWGALYKAHGDLLEKSPGIILEADDFNKIDLSAATRSALGGIFYVFIFGIVFSVLFLEILFDINISKEYITYASLFISMFALVTNIPSVQKFTGKLLLSYFELFKSSSK